MTSVVSNKKQVKNSPNQVRGAFIIHNKVKPTLPHLNFVTTRLTVSFQLKCNLANQQDEDTQNIQDVTVKASKTLKTDR